MDTEKLKLNARIYGVRAKAKLKLVIMMLGMAMVVLGAYNMLGVPALDSAPIAPYRSNSIVGAQGGGFFYLSDVVVMAVGAAIVWWS